MLEDDSWLRIILLILLIIGSAFFSATETSISSVNKIRIKSNAEKGDRRAKSLLSILDNFENVLTTLLIGNNIVNMACASIATVLAINLWGNDSVAYMTLAVTIVIFFFGEMLPKSYAKANSERYAMSVSAIVNFLMKIFRPLTFIFSAFGKGVAKLAKSNGEATVTEDELYDIIETIKEDGNLDEEKSDLVHSALLFADITVEDILTARVDIVALDIEMLSKEVLAEIKAQKHSRIPVYRDTIDNIVGILHIRKFLKAYMKDGEAVKLEDMLDEPFFVYRNTNVDELLPQMSRKMTHMAIVTDDFGGTLGIVTVEDMLEELVGEIWDEDDEIVELFKKVGDNKYEVKAGITVVDAFEEIEYDDFDRDEFGHKTMGAWALESLERMPAAGESFKYKNMMISVKSVEHNRIKDLAIEIMNNADESEDSVQTAEREVGA